MSAIEYLLESDPAVRWQVMRDLTDAAPEEVAAERARVATEGCGARLLAEQAEDGLWDGGTYRPGWVDESRPFYDAWSATHPSLELLRAFGPDPAAPEVVRAITRVRENVRWDHDGQPYFDGEVEPCINGGALANAAYFGQDGREIVETLLSGQLADGGWNCWDEDGTSRSSFHSTICALEGLWAWEQGGGGSDAVTAARLRGEEYLLARRLLRRASTGELIDPRFAMPSFPTRWYYDVLRALDYFRSARPDRDDRCAEAIELLRAKMLPFGMWKLELTHQGPTLFDLEAEHEGFPSRWVTLRALRVLRWWDGA
ncbi:hypothetical protein NQ156_12130 [Microbacterium sp. zg.Y625]|uniref:hypothetical protein n=1 Tax=Microbacterium jiangjiandongii TaxID=3049071 RepID=UPI00214AE1AB|nr:MULTISPECIES: hypothetical protein [unclassified Microbacterium]MCR2793814.1 hypothetical protein [Microbacterium sp. zg.Y625]WIM26154.1 hypothetical protein QNO14_03610 [Microbacterium sp. zg-Y625]